MLDAPEKSRTATVTLKLDGVQRERLKSLAATKKRTAHHLLKEAIDRYLQTEEAQLAILDSVDGAVAHFEATGQHITLDEVKTWAQTLKTQPGARMPDCHT